MYDRPNGIGASSLGAPLTPVPLRCRNYFMHKAIEVLTAQLAEQKPLPKYFSKMLFVAEPGN